jgi:hypothetical protein
MVDNPADPLAPGPPTVDSDGCEAAQVDDELRPAPSGGTARTHGPPEAPSHHIEDLVDVGVRLASLGRGPDAALHVILEDEQGHGVDRRSERGGLLEDVDAVLLALDHPADASDLALDPAEPAKELGAVLGVAVAERSVIVVVLDHEGRGLVRSGDSWHGRMIPPGGIATQARPRVRTAVAAGRLLLDACR